MLLEDRKAVSYGAGGAIGGDATAVVADAARMSRLGGES
jgi:hypothetical protein